ncbi:DUF4440 domain-containing protein [Mycolicibacterium duvalii]|uniref:Uncharacterized protein n=1 Tax=Mycolicibacterium duvalii TaxID=39688 RepID=A0A7I7JWR9_9MYCO|nr:nuclear transport factor 2 family protein [Mycolicibacterium duvalii]MCV7370416.1 nuclear transport factor 2 family protein [Mycolicibacterium duvalii]PEG38151.1 DUF4440 domain-containing protein [Mycolicibacterium duvalii]BBX15749.1 hypothetical protein MDUV_06090 [Mycolicibacterium duvalii]
MSTQEENIALVRQGYEAFSRGDMETVLSLYDDDIEWIQPGESEVSGTYRGKAELAGLLTRMGEKMTSITPLRFLGDDDTVVVISQATVGGETSQDVEVFTLRDGKAVRAQTFGDTAMMERHFGRKAVAAS